MTTHLFQQRLVEVEGGMLNLAVGPPHGEPLVLLHGVTRCWQDFEPILPALMTRHQLFAVDFRGHGRSSRFGDKYRVVDYARDIAELLERHIHGTPVLFGHSLGAMVAVAVAAEKGNRVRALILEDPPFETMGRDITATPFADFFRGMLAVSRSVQGAKGQVGSDYDESVNDVRATAQAIGQILVGVPGKPRVRLGETRDASAIRFMASCLQQLDPQVLESIVDGGWLEGYNRDAIFSRITCPTLLLQGDVTAGGTLTEHDGARMEQLIKDCTRIFVPRAGHLLHWLHTDVLLRHVLSFLASLGDCHEDGAGHDGR